MRKQLSLSRADWIRTSDLLTPSQTRYQTALRPESCQYIRARAEKLEAVPKQLAGRAILLLILSLQFAAAARTANFTVTAAVFPVRSTALPPTNGAILPSISADATCHPAGTGARSNSFFGTRAGGVM